MDVPGVSEITLKQDVLSICKKLAVLGEECFFLCANIKEKSSNFMGSSTGQDFLSSRLDIVEQFYQYCVEKQKIKDLEVNQVITITEQVKQEENYSFELLEDTSSVDTQSTAVRQQEAEVSSASDGKVTGVTQTPYNEATEFYVMDQALEDGDDEDGDADFEEDVSSEVNAAEKQIIIRTTKSPKQHTSPVKKDVKNKPNLECNVCGKIFTKAALLENHSWVHTGKMFNCNICGKRYANKNTFNQHMGFHLQTYKHKCDICEKSFHTITKLVIHKRTHTGEKPHPCLICNRKFVTRTVLKAHMAIHSDNRPFECSICKRTFKLRKSLVQHEKTHEKNKMFYCNICNQKFNKELTYKGHLMLEHGGENPFKCDICGKTLKSSVLLNRHKFIHTDEKPFSCSVCSKSFKAKKNLDTHMIVHTRKSFDCKKCQLSFRRKTAYDLHMVQHGAPSPFICNICGKSFVRKRKLENHKLTHSQIKKFRCDQCPKRFHSPLNLNNHKNNMHRFNKHKCETCGKCFSMPSILQRHAKVHEKEYKCSKCETIFKQEFQLKRHLKAAAKEKEHKCSYCCMSFDRVSQMTYHMNIHTKTNTHVCEYCGTQFLYAASLRKHYKLHKEADEMEQEEEALKVENDANDSDLLDVKPTIETGMNSESGENVQNQSDDIKIIDSSELTPEFRKSLTKSNDKRYQCADCKNLFRSLARLDQHIKAAVQKRKYQCTLCCTSCDTQSQLKRHMTFHVKKLTVDKMVANE